MRHCIFQSLYRQAMRPVAMRLLSLLVCYLTLGPTFAQVVAPTPAYQAPAKESQIEVAAVSASETEGTDGAESKTSDAAKSKDESESASGDEEKKMTEEEKKKAAEAQQKKQDDWLKEQLDKKIAAFACDRIPSRSLEAWATPPTSDDKDVEDGGAEDKDGEDKDGEDKDGEDKDGEDGDGEDKDGEDGGAEDGEAAADSETAATEVPNKETKAKLEAFENSLENLQRMIRLGKWSAVKTHVAELDSIDHQKALYLRILAALAEKSNTGPDLTGVSEQDRILMEFAMRQQNRNGGQFAEVSLISMPDIIGLIQSAPCQLDKFDDAGKDAAEKPGKNTAEKPGKDSAPDADRAIRGLGRLLQISLQNGNVIDALMTQLKAGPPLMPKREAAKMFSAAEQNHRMGDFLPTVDQAKKDDDREALNLLSRYYVSMNDREPSVAFLEQAWQVNQAVLAVGKVSKEQKQEAVRRAVELIPQVDEEFGNSWMRDSFRNRPERGKEMLAAIGEACGQSFQRYMYDAEQRERLLVMQSTAATSLLEQLPNDTEAWRGALNILAQHWMREAQNSLQHDNSTSYGSQMRRDRYGNIFYSDAAGGMNSYEISRQRHPMPVPTADVLKSRPQGKWRDALEPGIAAKFDVTASRLFLKVNEAEKAFPYIEQMAEEMPEQAKELADEFLRVWAKNHSPNEERDRTSFYMFNFGYSNRAERIPLTRSKQNRNLTELAEWAQRLKRLPIDDWDESLLVTAFTTSHSDAEVYRLSDIEKIFGSIDNLEAETLATFAQRMRKNLAALWRQPKVQKDNNTNRKQKDIQIEVQRGYATAVSVLKNGAAAYPGDWQLKVAQACLDYDQNDYANEINKSADFAEGRKAALQKFEAAATAYAEKVGDLPEEDQSVDAFEKWFYACLGAPDIGRIESKSVPMTSYVADVADALNALPKHVLEHHRRLFANNMFSRLSAVDPSCKFRYLREAFKIIGDHEQAHEAKKVFDYYKDLVTEIKLGAEVDGSADVGREPFGLLVNLHHTQAIERESGGFGRYLQNQNSGSSYYNYGRPTENYRDKFEEAAVAALDEHFEVLSVTFNKPSVNSKAVAEEGWRVTPYAYLLLKAKGPEVDKIPSLRLDLDFLDTSGYAILPVETPHLPINAGKLTSDQELPTHLEITQTLDERQATDGKLILEVKATGTGLIPPLNRLADFQPAGFDITSTDDQGVAVTEFDLESDATAVKSERLWVFTMEADQDKPMPKEFAFAQVQTDDATIVYQRFVDADVESVDQIIALERDYPRARRRWLLPVAVLAGLLLLGSVAWMMSRSAPEAIAMATYQFPEKVTPFTAIHLLEQIHSTNGLKPGEKKELSHTIHRLQSYYFDDDKKSQSGAAPDLTAVMHDWIAKTRL